MVRSLGWFASKLPSPLRHRESWAKLLLFIYFFPPFPFFGGQISLRRVSTKHSIEASTELNSPACRSAHTTAPAAATAGAIAGAAHLLTDRARDGGEHAIAERFAAPRHVDEARDKALHRALSVGAPVAGIGEERRCAAPPPPLSLPRRTIATLSATSRVV